MDSLMIAIAVRSKQTAEQKRLKWNEYKRNYDKAHRKEISEIQNRWREKDENKQNQIDYHATKIFCDVCKKYLVFSYKARHEATDTHIKKLTAQLLAAASTKAEPSVSPASSSAESNSDKEPTPEISPPTVAITDTVSNSSTI